MEARETTITTHSNSLPPIKAQCFPQYLCPTTTDHIPAVPFHCVFYAIGVDIATTPSFSPASPQRRLTTPLAPVDISLTKLGPSARPFLRQGLFESSIASVAGGLRHRDMHWFPKHLIPYASQARLCAHPVSAPFAVIVPFNITNPTCTQALSDQRAVANEDRVESTEAKREYLAGAGHLSSRPLFHH